MTQLRGDSHQNSDDYSGNRKKEAHSGDVLVIESTGFAEKLGMGVMITEASVIVSKFQA